VSIKTSGLKTLRASFERTIWPKAYPIKVNLGHVFSSIMYQCQSYMNLISKLIFIPNLSSALFKMTSPVTSSPWYMTTYVLSSRTLYRLCKAINKTRSPPPRPFLKLNLLTQKDGWIQLFLKCCCLSCILLIVE